MYRSIKYYYFLFIISSIHCQTLVQWDKTIGGSGSDGVNSIIQTLDGGYLFGGSSSSSISGDKTQNSKGLVDYWLVKTDNIGNIQWQNTIGANDADLFWQAAETSDGGFILGGKTSSTISGDKSENPISMGYFDYWVVKTNSVGVVQWENTIGGNSDDHLTSIQQTGDGGYVVGGYTDSNISGDKTQNSKGLVDYWILKLDSLGNITWQKTYGGSGQELLRDIKQTSDGGYIVAGHSNSNISGDKTQNSQGFHDYWILKLDNLGDITWQKTYGGSQDDILMKINQTSDGGYIVGGYSPSNISGDKTQNSKGQDDYWILKLASNGNIQWQKTFGGSDFDDLYSILETSDGGYICCGSSFSNISGDKNQSCIGWNDYWIIKLDNSGSSQGQLTVGGNDRDGFTFMIQASDGNYILGGGSQSNISGDKTQNCKGLDDIWIVKISSGVGIKEINSSEINFSIEPNPSSGIIKIKSPDAKNGLNISVTNTLGEKVYSEKIISAEEHSINLSNLPKGMYFLTLEKEDQKGTQKIIIE